MSEPGALPELRTAILENVRAICAALPEVSERLSHEAPTFFVRGTRVVCAVHEDPEHGHGIALWVPAPPGVQEQAVETEPERFFRPPYVGHVGWLGVRLDVEPDWDEVAAMVREAYGLVAPKASIAELGIEG